MGQAAADLEVEIEGTRQRLDETLSELRRLRLPSRRQILISLAVAGGVGATATTVLIIRGRRPRPAPLSHLVARTPERVGAPLRGPARSADRVVASAGRSIRLHTDAALDGMSERLARAIVSEQRRREPLWQKLAVTAGTAAISVSIPRLLERTVVKPRSAA